LSVSGAEIQNDGTVTDGGSVTITYVNGVPATMAGLAKDYGVVPNDILLQGTVLEVLLEATGDDTLDVLFSVSGGALQNVNPALGTNFAPTNLALLRIAGVALPADFSQCFDLSGATIDVLSIPEPSSVMLCLLGAMFALAGTSKHYSFGVTRR
jgi:hypothetical protein